MAAKDRVQLLRNAEWKDDNTIWMYRKEGDKVERQAFWAIDVRLILGRNLKGDDTGWRLHEEDLGQPKVAPKRATKKKKAEPVKDEEAASLDPLAPEDKAPKDALPVKE